MNENQRILALTIARLPGLKPNEKVFLCRHFADVPSEFFSGGFLAIDSLIERPLSKRQLSTPWNIDELREKAENDALLAKKWGVSFVFCFESAYPPQLLEIFDPPPVIFYRGGLPDPTLPHIAIVGTRKPTGAGVSAAFNFAREFGRLGFPVVSGLALGIDAIAHKGCVESGGRTFAVLGSSPDEVYPKTNRMLAQRILDTGGGLLSEYPPGTKPNAWQFPARNRLIAGLARGVLIIEAPEKSGALITARFAAEQNRDLFVTRLSLNSSRGTGCVKLAEDGVKAVASAEDILQEWGWSCTFGGEE
ncbi:MAG: DNA-processing protein DprA [Treponema sp.]|jgi:DNA processing protein|nr:DNA-processing protein DprA [Treponema sp.]